jgi:hypothetical protein
VDQNLRKGCVQNILLMIGGIFIAFFLAEILLRTIRPQIFDVHPQGMYIEDPDIGYTLTPDFTGELVSSEFRMEFHTNSLGLRGEELRPRQNNTVRILLLGDSQAWGFGVAEAETMSVLLEQSLSTQYPNFDIQVVNGGVPGYGTADELAFLQAKGDLLQPDIVIVQFLSVNDLSENRTPAREWAIIEDGFLASRFTPDENDLSLSTVFERARRWIKLNSHLGRLLFDVGGYLGTRAGILGEVDALWGEDFTQEDAKLGVELLVHIAETANKLGAETLFLYTTSQAHVIPAVYDPPKSSGVVETASKEANVPWIDSARWLNQHPDKYLLYYPKNGHWTPTGHAAVAELVANSIVALPLINP